MNRLPVICCWLALGTAAALGGDDPLDRLTESLAWTAAHDNLRVRLSGSLDLEYYSLQQPAPGLIEAEGGALFNPRLALFLDAQLGPQVYVFAQARVDRGFDAGDGATECRIDEYAVRITPWASGPFNLQIGKFGTVVGNWVARHHSWENPFITAPLPYEGLTGVFDSVAADSAATLVRWSRFEAGTGAGGEYLDRYRVPILWGPSYASGAAISGTIGRATCAIELKNASLSSRPERWDASHTQWQHPTLSARLGWHPDESWSLGLSASTGSYLTPEARPTLAPGHGLGDYRQVVWGQDIAYAWHHLQVWAEAYEASFAIPGVGHARTLAYYLEAKYKFTPQLSGAVRWNRQLYGDIADGIGGRVPWGRDVWRLDVAPAYRFSPHMELKIQYSVQAGGIGPRDRSRMLAVQFVTRF